MEWDSNLGTVYWNKVIKSGFTMNKWGFGPYKKGECIDRVSNVPVDKRAFKNFNWITSWD